MDSSGLWQQLDWTTGRNTGRDLRQLVGTQKKYTYDDKGYVLSKYTEYDEALKRGDQDAVSYLLKDDTVYAYAALQWEGKPVRMRYYQDAILTDTNKRIDVEGANQQGKSYSLCVKAAVKFLQNHGRNTHIGLVSKSMTQNSMNMRMVRKMIQEARFSYTPGSNDNMTVMVHQFPNGYTNTLILAVAGTSALGFPFDWLLLDEFEFWENPEGLEYMFDQILDPRTFETNGQIIIYSNPNGRNFVSEKLQKRMITLPSGVVVPECRVYNIDYLDNLANSRERWDLKQKYTHPIIFASTMAALRTESEGSALTEEDIQSCVSDTKLTAQGFHALVDNMASFFVDLGFIHDQSCVVGGFKKIYYLEDGTVDKNKKSEFFMVYKTYPQAYDLNSLWGHKAGTEPSVPDLIRKYGSSNSALELDITGKEGNEILAQQAGFGLTKGVKMTGPWKAKWYERFISLAKQGRIKIALTDNWVDGDNKDFVFQSRSLQISTKMPDGRTRPYPLYHHKNEKDHDDILDAVVGCLSIIDDELDNFSGYLFIPYEKEDKQQEDKKEVDDTIAGYDNYEETMRRLSREHAIYGGVRLW